MTAAIYHSYKILIIAKHCGCHSFISPSFLPLLSFLSLFLLLSSLSLLLGYVIVKDRTKVQFEQLVPDGELSASIFMAAVMVGRWASSLPKLLDLRGEVSVDDVVTYPFSHWWIFRLFFIFGYLWMKMLCMFISLHLSFGEYIHSLLLVSMPRSGIWCMFSHRQYCQTVFQSGVREREF